MKAPELAMQYPLQPPPPPALQLGGVCLLQLATLTALTGLLLRSIRLASAGTLQHLSGLIGLRRLSLDTMDVLDQGTSMLRLSCSWLLLLAGPPEFVLSFVHDQSRTPLPRLLLCCLLRCCSACSSESL